MLLLASKSPRRRELLKMLDIPFETIEIKKIEEVYPQDMPPEEVPEYLSKLKAFAYMENIRKGDILITADTVVILNNEIIGKPEDERNAKKTLSRLSGNVHKVITGVTLTSSVKTRSFSVVTEVEFASLSPEDISYYVEKYKPLDKAGAYGIQEWIGAVGIKSIVGSFYNVMGLPVHQLYRQLLKF